MKKLFLLMAMMCISATAFADVKIKTKQTMSGQTTESTTYIKGKRTRSELAGGAMVTVTQCDLGRDLTINPTTKTYTVTTYDDGGSGTAGQAGQSVPVTKGGTMFVTTTIRDTGERKQMFGFTARHIVQTIETETSPDSCSPMKSKMEMEMWVIDAEFASNCTQTRTYTPNRGGRAGGCTDKIVPKTIGSAKPGYPLWQKMTSFDATGKESFSMISEVVELSKSVLDAGLFDAPADYREVKDAASLYAASAPASSGVSYRSPDASGPGAVSSSLGNSIRGTAAVSVSGAADAAAVGPKIAGTVRVGLAGVKTGAVGEGINAADLAAAVQNSLQTYLRGTKIDLVFLDAKLVSAVADEARQKECDVILTMTASHKKGGSGFGAFGKMLGSVVSQTGIGHTGSTAGNIVGQMATTAIISSAQVSGSVRSKDELTLDIRLQMVADSSTPLARQFKAKAKSDGDDIISAAVEQAAEAIVNSLQK